MTALMAARLQGPRPRPIAYIVDDDPVTLALLCEVAADAGWDARGFERLGELSGALETAVPSLLILDDNLPDGRGGDLARDLRDDERLADVPLVVCTAAHPMRQAEINAWAPVLAKPFNLNVLEGLLDDARARAQGYRRHTNR